MSFCQAPNGNVQSVESALQYLETEKASRSETLVNPGRVSLNRSSISIRILGTKCMVNEVGLFALLLDGVIFVYSKNPIGVTVSTGNGNVGPSTAFDETVIPFSSAFRRIPSNGDRMSALTSNST